MQPYNQLTTALTTTATLYRDLPSPVSLALMSDGRRGSLVNQLPSFPPAFKSGRCPDVALKESSSQPMSRRAAGKAFRPVDMKGVLARSTGRSSYGCVSKEVVSMQIIYMSLKRSRQKNKTIYIYKEKKVIARVSKFHWEGKKKKKKLPTRALTCWPVLFYSSNEQGSNIDVFKYQHSLFRQRNHHTEKRQTDQGAQTPYNDKKVRGGGQGYTTQKLWRLFWCWRHTQNSR